MEKKLILILKIIRAVMEIVEDELEERIKYEDPYENRSRSSLYRHQDGDDMFERQGDTR